MSKASASSQNRKKAPSQSGSSIPEPLQPFKPYIFGVVGLLVLAIIALGIYEYKKPPQGTWRLGLCRVFVENYIRYPHTLYIEEVFEAPSFAELSVNYLNAHGFRPTRIFRCDYQQTQNGGIEVKEIRIDREKQSQLRVDLFNKTLPVIMSDPTLLNVDLPEPFDGTYEGLKR